MPNSTCHSTPHSGANESGSPRVSIVIPAHNAAATLPLVLRALDPRPADWEVIVVDDHSTDDTRAIAQAAGARVLTSHTIRNCYAARNTGGLAARGELLAFLDSDVEVSVPQLEQMIARFEASDLSCSFAVYDQGAHLDSLVSRFKNYWIRHSTLCAPRPPRWINTSLALMRRASYLEAGTFNEVFSVRRGGGDLFFGKRLSDICGPIAIDEKTAVRHHKRFTLASLLRNDFRRARGWFRLALSRRGLRGVARRPSLANVRRRFSIGVLAAGASLPLLALTLIHPAFAIASLATIALQVALASAFLLSARRERVRGSLFFAPLLFIDQLACACALGLEIVRWSVISPRTRPAFDESEPRQVDGSLTSADY